VRRQDVRDRDRRKTRPRSDSTCRPPITALAIFGVQLFANVLRNIIVSVQNVTLLHKWDQSLEVVRL
jgi:hypothetical protein